MIKEATTRLRAAAADVRACAAAVSIAACEDRPADAERDDHKLLRDLEDATQDLLGSAAEVQAAAEAADVAAGRDDCAALSRALALEHRLSLGLSQRMREGPLAADRLAELRRLARSWGAQWQVWAGVVLVGLTGVQVAVDLLEERVLCAWTAFADRTLHPPIQQRTEQ